MKYLCILISFYSYLLMADDQKVKSQLSLSEILDLVVHTGSLSEIKASQSANAISIIDRERIELSTAKNLAELLEQYIPGMMLMMHSEGPKIGIRGLIAAENYKLLLLVNGRNFTNMVYEGVIMELGHWDLDDIERIEVVRGPGSVTYGTGAIGGVINIITKGLKTADDGITGRTSYFQQFDSKGVNVEYRGQLSDGIELYSFISYRKTSGYSDPEYYQFNSGYLDNPIPYLADALDRPQVKAQIDLGIGKDTRVWFRYLQGGQTHNFRSKVFSEDTEGNQLEEKSSHQVGLRGAIVSAQHKILDGETHSLDGTLTYDNQEYIRYRFFNRSYPVGDPENIQQYAFSQERTTAQLLYHYTLKDRLHLIVGHEYSHIGVHAPWGRSSNEIWIYEGVDMISSAQGSRYVDDNLNNRADITDAVEIGSGLHFETHSHLLEGNYRFSSDTMFTYAHRIDFPDVSDTMVSPRASVSSQIDEENTVVVTTQRALRMMPLRAQYLAHKDKQSDDHESIDSIELSLTNQSIGGTALVGRAFYNKIHAVGYTGKELKFLSDIDLYGFELEANYKTLQRSFMVNHSFLEPSRIEMNASLKDGANRNNTSFADYYYQTKGDVPLLLTGHGNGLNNWSKNSTRFSYTEIIADTAWQTHLSSIIYWDFSGSYDEMKMYEDAYANVDVSTLSAEEQTQFAEQKEEFYARKAALEKEGSFDNDYTVNASVSYNTSYDSKDLKISLFADNLLSSKKRYYVSTGSSGTTPSRLQFMKEPQHFGIKFEAGF